MKRIIKLDAQGRQEVMEATRRTNARFKEIEEESARRTGRPLSGLAVRAMALPISEEQAAKMQAEAEKEDGTPPL